MIDRNIKGAQERFARQVTSAHERRRGDFRRALDQGGTVRSVAAATGLSKSRVHQIVTGK